MFIINPLTSTFLILRWPCFPSRIGVSSWRRNNYSPSYLRPRLPMWVIPSLFVSCIFFKATPSSVDAWNWIGQSPVPGCGEAGIAESSDKLNQETRPNAYLLIPICLDISYKRDTRTYCLHYHLLQNRNIYLLGSVRPATRSNVNFICFRGLRVPHQTDDRLHENLNSELWVLGFKFPHLTTVT